MASLSRNSISCPSRCRTSCSFAPVCEDKAGVSEERFYRELIRKADLRFDRHLAGIRKPKR